MIRLKTILQYKNTTLIILIIVLLLSLIRLSIPKHSILNINTNNITGTLLEYKIDGDKLTFIIKDKEKVRCTYYLKEKNELSNLELGIKIKVTGTLNIPNENTIPNTFNYKRYLYNKDIFYIMSVDNISIIDTNTNIFYEIKNKLINYINKFKSKGYLQTFITGNKNYLEEGSYEQYRELGVSHIFAISGMHVSILASIIFKLLGKIKDNIKYYIVITFLLFYSFITSFTASILRSISLYISLFINKRLYLNLNTIQTYYISITILLIINPHLIYDIGFIYSSLVSFSLIRYNHLIKGNYIMKCLKISLISFLFSLPITINNNYEINILSIINNLVFVPLITFIIYPLSLLTLFIPLLDNIYFNLLELTELISNNLFVLNIIIPKLNIFLIIIYYIFLHIFFISYQKKYLLIVLLIIIFNKYSCLIDNSYYVYFLDVGQGDSSVIKYKDEVIMIDTGGKMNYEKEEWRKKKEYHISDNTIKFLKSIGATNIDYLILTHGDYDHLGEAEYLINNFKVKELIINCGDINDLEKNLLINKYNYCIKELNLNKSKLYFINNNLYDNENDNSIVIYTKLYNTSLLLMGDASKEVEHNILKEYNLENIDILKVGHHGSKTSTSEYFINTINPKYSIISVGKNNRYGHPNKEVLDNIKNYKIYRTDEDGSIIFKIKNKKMKIETCSS